MILRRLPVRSIQAPSSGPEIRLGKVTAATVAPATAALPVRASTSSTTATENISIATRGPVLSVTTFSNEAEAIEVANSTVYGLGAAVFSNDASQCMRLTSSIDSGTVRHTQAHAQHSRLT